MKNFPGKLKASRNALYFHSASLGLLYISWFYSISVHRSGFFNLRGEQKYLAWIDSLPIRFLSNTGLILLALQFILIIVTIIWVRSKKAAKEKNYFIESTIISFSAMNVVLFIMLIAAMNLYFFRNKFDLLFFPISVFIAAFFISYFILKETDEDEITSGSGIKHMIAKIIETSARFGFPNYKLIGIATSLVGIPSIVYFNRKVTLNLYLVFAGTVIIIIGGLYVLAGSYFNYKKKDELEKLIFLEQTLIRNRFIYGTLFIVYLLLITFHIRLDNFLTIFVIAPIILLFEAFIKDKYE